MIYSVNCYMAVSLSSYSIFCKTLSFLIKLVYNKIEMNERNDTNPIKTIARRHIAKVLSAIELARMNEHTVELQKESENKEEYFVKQNLKKHIKSEMWYLVEDIILYLERNDRDEKNGNKAFLV